MRRLLSGALLTGALLLVVAPAWPHAYLVKSVPARRATLIRPPDRVQLWFNERLEAPFCRLSVWSTEGRQVDLGDVRVDPEDGRNLTVGLSPLSPGAYVVKFRVLSIDGHVVADSFSFTLRAGR